MRVDPYTNQTVPSTLGEYRDICAAIGGESCSAVHFLDAKIAEQGRDELVVAPDSQMRELLMLMLIRGIDEQER